MKRNQQAQSRYKEALRSRVNAGRVAVRDQIDFFSRHFGQVSSEWKEDDSRVTFADFALSERLFEALCRLFPEDHYCSEESNPLDEVIMLESPFSWIIDPIDGTNNFALGVPFCAISMALLHEGVPVYGFIYDHSGKVLYEGGADLGLFCNRKKLDRSQMTANAQAMVGLNFPMPSGKSRCLRPIMENYRCRSFGSGALTATYVATGYLNGAIDYRVKVWDIAAAYALCLSAGVGFEFIGTSPFPLKTFHPRMESCPYYAGTGPVFEEIVDCLN